MRQLRWFAALALSLIAAPAAAQTINGTVTEAGSGQPVNGAIVILVDAEGRKLAGALADERGKFSIVAPAAGRYTLRAERVGLQSTTSPPLDLAEGQVLEYALAAGTAPVNLAAVRVTARGRCEAKPDEGRETRLVWEEARKALTSTALSQEQRRFGVEVAQYHRVLGPNALDVRSETRTHRSGVTENPFVSIPAARLSRGGYLEHRADGTWYYAPDANVLLSEEFLRDHCFRLRRDDASHAGMIGLAFEPVRGRRVPDVEGVLWLEEKTAALRYLEFRYTNLPYRAGSDLAGGRVDFDRTAAGLWFVRRWRIRMPTVDTNTTVQRAVLPGGGHTGRAPEVLRSIREEGGEVTSVVGGSRAAMATLAGVVHDSLRGGPLPGARVFLSGTQYGDTTDSSGAFRLLELPEGTYTVSFVHPLLDFLGVLPQGQPVALKAGAEASVALATPSREAVLADACPAAKRDEGSGLVAGIATDVSTGKPLVDASIAGLWTEWAPASGQLRARVRKVEASTDAEGRFLLCGVPRDVPVEIAARGWLDQSDGEALLVERGVAIADLRVAPIPAALLASARGPGGASRPAPARLLRSSFRTVPGESGPNIVGVVVDTEGKAIASATVTLVGAGRTRSDQSGMFRFAAVPAGRQVLAVRALGYAEDQMAVEVVAGHATRVTLALHPQPAVIAASVTTGAARPGALLTFDQRRAQGIGYFLTQEQIERRGGLHTSDVLRTVPGVVVTEVNGNFGPEQQVSMGRARNSLRLQSRTLGNSESYMRAPSPNDTALSERVSPEDYVDAASDNLLNAPGAAVCKVTYFIDGAPFDPSPGSIDAVVRLQDIAAMEIYRNVSEVPMQFMSGNAQCGVIVIWTKDRLGKVGGKK